MHESFGDLPPLEYEQKHLAPEPTTLAELTV